MIGLAAPHLFPVKSRVVTKETSALKGDSKPYFHDLSVVRIGMLSVVRCVCLARKCRRIRPGKRMRHLRFAHDQLRAIFDFRIVNLKPERDVVARIVGPLDDLDQLPANKILMPMVLVSG